MLTRIAILISGVRERRELADTLVPPDGRYASFAMVWKEGIQRREFYRDAELVSSPKPPVVWAFFIFAGI